MAGAVKEDRGREKSIAFDKQLRPTTHCAIQTIGSPLAFNRFCRVCMKEKSTDQHVLQVIESPPTGESLTSDLSILSVLRRLMATSLLAVRVVGLEGLFRRFPDQEFALLPEAKDKICTRRAYSDLDVCTCLRSVFKCLLV